MQVSYTTPNFYVSAPQVMYPPTFMPAISTVTPMMHMMPMGAAVINVGGSRGCRCGGVYIHQRYIGPTA